MRVSESLRYANLRAQIGGLQSKLDASTRDVTSGLRVREASDAPASAATAQRIDAAQRKQLAFARVADRMEGELEASDVALDSANKVLVSARELASQFGSSAWNEAAWVGAEARADELIASMLSAANASHGGVYLFGGTADDAPPFDASGAYTGATTGRRVEVQKNEFVELVRGDEAFGGAADAFASLAQLQEAVAARDPDAVRAAGDALAASFDQVLAAREHIGRRVELVQSARSFGEVLSERHAVSRDQAVGSDLIESLTKIEQHQLGLQYAVQVASVLDDVNALARL